MARGISKMRNPPSLHLITGCMSIAFDASFQAGYGFATAWSVEQGKGCSSFTNFLNFDLLGTEFGLGLGSNFS